MLTETSSSVLQPLIEVDFSLTGNSTEFSLTGFSHPESTHTWGLSPNSSISFRPFKKVKCIFVLFEIEPFVPFQNYEGFNLWIFVDAEVSQMFKLANRLVVSIRVETQRKLDEGFIINFLCVDAARPEGHLSGEMRPLAFRLSKVLVYGSSQNTQSSRRLANRIIGSESAELSASLTQQTHLSPADLTTKFESLGHSCDFGLFQRRLGVDPLSLFRFSGIDIVDLTRGILTGFKGLGQSFDLHYREELHEYIITENGYGITSHTHVRTGQLKEDEIIEREKRKLLFLRRKFMEDVNLGGKIFLIRKPNLNNERHIEALWVTLNMHATNPLLLVKQTPAWTPGLTVEGLGTLQGELSGEIGQTQPNDESWLKLLGNAYLAVERKM